MDQYTITLDGIKKAIQDGQNTTVIINGQYYDIASEEDDKSLYTVRQLMQWNDTLWEKYGYTSRPQGIDFIDLVLEMAAGIASAFKPEELTQEVLDMLENENYHTLCHAIHVVKQLHKYA